MTTKDELHRVVDSIDDEKVLKQCLTLVVYLKEAQPTSLWNSLTDDEQNELLLSDTDSQDAANLISHEEVKKSLKKWLKTKTPT